MARRKVTKRIKLKSWEEVNEALRHIAEMQSAIDARVAAYNEEEAKRRKQVDEFTNPLRDQIDMYENGMADFCEENRQDFGDKKSKELPNGRVDFRLSTPKVAKNKGITWKAILDIVRNSKFAKRYIRTKEELNKDQILADYASQQVTNDDLQTVQLKVEQEESFGYAVYYGAQKEAA